MFLSFSINAIALIILGIFVNQNPNLVAGNISKYDIQLRKKVATILRNCFIVTGALIFDFSCLMYFFETPIHMQKILIIIINILGLVIGMVLSNITLRK